ncbi:MAG: hypothetical protein JKY24_00475 [Pseudomonadales bacterium]|nr:hypothetical protein [Pseudomonadales bacterium]
MQEQRSQKKLTREVQRYQTITINNQQLQLTNMQQIYCIGSIGNIINCKLKTTAL